MAEIILKNGREKSLLRHHPWIFSGAVAKILGSPRSGETIDVLSSDGQFLAKAAFSPNSQIIGRVWTWDENESIDSDLFQERIKWAIESRNNFFDLSRSNAIRLVHGESDGVPGLILDQYGDLFVIQLLTAGVEFWRSTLIDIVIKLTGAKSVYERSDVDVRQLEGLPFRNGVLYGQSPEQPIIIQENGLKFYVDIVNGHKTGFYIDQRENRWLVRNMARGLKILDCFSYTGGFAVNALEGGASSVVLVDSSSAALSLAHQNIEKNELDTDIVQFIEQDVFKLLRMLRDKRELFDLVILDPPKFAPTVAQAERATRGYKDINLLAFKLLRPGGYLVTFSCSGGVSEDLFQKIVAGAALDAGADALIIDRLHQGADHPVALNFPEGAYLKGFIIQRRN
jgi:23S rRNA (cytosine1962-C5)-methyltransferase